MTSHVSSDVDFTSALFLDFRHRAQELPLWQSLTTGVPAALRSTATSAAVARLVAHEHWTAAGSVARSTLHAAIDVLGTLPRSGDRILLDRAGYPITQLAALLPRSRGVAVADYPHHRPDLARVAGRGRIWFVTDGWCPGCNRPAPIRLLQEIASHTGGGVVVDDSLAYGVLGRRLGDDRFGDGTGTVHWCGCDHTGIVWLASLAKAYGTPLAVITGDAETLSAVRERGINYVHSSPPSNADLAAAGRALQDPSRQARRARLHRNTLLLRHACETVGLTPLGLPFPAVAIAVSDRRRAVAWWRWLERRGLHTLLLHSRCRSQTLLTAIVRTDHSERALHRLAAALGTLTARREAACIPP
ncbi:hypothetical protein [Rhodococcus aetherivorans]